LTISQKNELPIDSSLAAIKLAWESKRSLVIKAAPGSGKTTRVPAYIAEASNKKVIVLEPRRLAARLSAEWVASENGSSVGGFSGYQVRFERRWNDSTKVIFVTEGIFLNLIVNSPNLDEFGTVIIDEFHERHINTDIALSVTKKIQESSRPDLKLILMSATLDTSSLESFLSDAAVFDIPGRTFPVTTTYHPGQNERPTPADLAAAAEKMTKDPMCPGNILVFATGMREIRDVVGILQERLRSSGISVFPLSADTSRDDQDRIFSAQGLRKIIVSTNVAETSVTIPGITGVVDNGLAKISGYAEWSGMSTLDTRKISRASCIQRAGRAGRTAPGICYRAFSENDFLGRAEFTVPEIQRTDLAELILTLAAAKIISRCDLANLKDEVLWFEEPNSQHLATAVAFLKLIAAVDVNGILTTFGRRMSALPLTPRLAAMYVKGEDEGIHELIAAAVAVIGESGIHRFGSPPAIAHDCDIEFQSECLLKVISGQKLSFAENSAIDAGKMRSAMRVWQQLTKKNSVRFDELSDTGIKKLKKCILAGFPDRVAQRKVGSQRHGEIYSFCGGGGGVLARTSVLKNIDLVVAVDSTLTHARSGDIAVSIEIASGIDRDDLVHAPQSLFNKQSICRWNEKTEKAEVAAIEKYGEILLSEKVRAPQSPEEKEACSALLVDQLKANWEHFCSSNEYLSQYLQRSALLNKNLSAGFPEFTGELQELFIEMICDGRWSFESLGSTEIKSVIYEQLTWDQTQTLEKLAPEFVVLSGARKFPVGYRADAPPLIRGFIQDYFGTPSDITILDGRVTLSVELIGPNKRPLQITSSLAGFWKQTYQQLRPELSRKYPRHYWPENPESAEPVLLKSRLSKT
jgi:ATP-dependent helicase HrpB